MPTVSSAAPDRMPVSVLLLDGDDADRRTSWFAQVRPVLAEADEIILVVPEGRSPSPVPPGVRVVAHRAGPALSGLAAGLAACRNAVAVVLAPEAEPAPGWLHALLGPMEHDVVAGTGPMLDTGLPMQVSRPQATAGDAVVCRLDPACLALRVAAVDASAVGALTDLDDLCRRLVTSGHQLVVVGDAFVRTGRPGRPPADDVAGGDPVDQEITELLVLSDRVRQEPLLSAALIVKDEEENLPVCLSSLSGLVDEVVVYDTGSTDRTVEIAREAGAVVVEGYWDDDFARARNEALRHCTGEWVLSIDADETASGQANRIRSFLSVSWNVDCFTVMITNLTDGNGRARNGLDHPGPRLFRRERCRWQYRLHEQIVGLPDGPGLRGGHFAPLRLLHSGYLGEVAERRNKRDRNIRVAELGLSEVTDGTPDEQAANLLNVGRSYLWAGKIDEALARFDEIRQLECRDGQRRMALQHGAELLLNTGQLDRAEEWIAELRIACHPDSGIPVYLDGQLQFLRGDVGAAVDCFDRIGDVLTTDDGVTIAPESVAAARGLVLCADGQWEAAVEALMKAAAASGVPEWGPLATAVHAAGADLDMVAALVTEDSIPAALTAVLRCEPRTADAFLESLWTRVGDHPRVLATAIRVAPALSALRALEWSARLRRNGLAEHCPLRAVALHAGAPPAQRLRAWAVLESAFGEACDGDLLRDLAGRLDAGSQPALAAELLPLCPRIAAAVAPLEILAADR